MRTPARTLHLVDIENLCRDPDASEGVVRDVLLDYLALAEWQPGDLVQVASNPRLTGRFMWKMPVECTIHAACGPDGADLALLAHAEPEFVSRRARRLVVGSGDHAFVPRAIAARDLGVDVLVVAAAECVHHEWRTNGVPNRYLPEVARAAA